MHVSSASWIHFCKIKGNNSSCTEPVCLWMTCTNWPCTHEADRLMTEKWCLQSPPTGPASGSSNMLGRETTLVILQPNIVILGLSVCQCWKWSLYLSNILHGGGKFNEAVMGNTEPILHIFSLLLAKFPVWQLYFTTHSVFKCFVQMTSLNLLRSQT